MTWDEKPPAPGPPPQGSLKPMSPPRDTAPPYPKTSGMALGKAVAIVLTVIGVILLIAVTTCFVLFAGY